MFFVGPPFFPPAINKVCSFYFIRIFECLLNYAEFYRLFLIWLVYANKSYLEPQILFTGYTKPLSTAVVLWIYFVGNYFFALFFMTLDSWIIHWSIKKTATLFALVLYIKNISCHHSCTLKFNTFAGLKIGTDRVSNPTTCNSDFISLCRWSMTIIFSDIMSFKKTIS